MQAWLTRLFGLINLAKDNKLAWQITNQKTLQELNQQRVLADHDLSAQLTLKSLELEHRIALLKTQQATELAMLKTRCAEDLKDYQQYLKSLEQLKILTKASFNYLPESIALTIHHHAKFLLNQMWESENLDEKIRLEAQLVKFMLTMHEEAHAEREHSQLPEKTLRLMQEDAI